MKRTCLTLFFATYYFFMPFVMVNCSATDQPYALTTDASASESTATNTFTLNQCQNMEYLVEPCIDVLQAEEDRIQGQDSIVANALGDLKNFSACQFEENISESSKALKFQASDSTADATDAEPALDCESIISHVISAFQICDPLTLTDKYEGCIDLEDAMNKATTKCDSLDDSVTIDFCSTLTA